MKYVKIMFLLLSFSLLFGCSDAQEPDSLGYVVALGIDKAKKEEAKYDITIQFANPVTISGGASQEGGKGGKESIKNITVTAPSIYSAVNVANHVVSKVFTLSHTKVVVFSEEIAKAGIKDILETIGRSSDIRPNTYFTVCKSSAKDFLESVNPETEINPTRYYSMLFENDFSGFVPQTKSQDFYFFANSNEKNTVLPLSSKAEKKGTHNFDDSGYQYKLEDFSAGEIPSEKTEIQVMGMAIFDMDKYIGEMGDIETEIYNLLTGQYKSSYVTYYFSPTPDDPITILQQQNKKPKITVDTSGDIPKINLNVYVEADFTSSTPEMAVEEHLDEFSNEASADLKREIESFLSKTKEMKADIVGFGSFAKRNFLDEKEFDDYKWKEKYPNAIIDVNVDFEVRRTGLVVRSEK